MTIKYKTGGFNGVLIHPVEIERETEKCVWIKSSRHDKVSSYSIFHDTWQAAHEYLLARKTVVLESARRNLANAEKDLIQIQALVQPS